MFGTERGWALTCCNALGRRLIAMTSPDPIAAGLDAKRSAMLLRDARAVLRKVDVLMASAAAVNDPSSREIADLRSGAEHLVAHLARREGSERRRAREMARRQR